MDEEAQQCELSSFQSDLICSSTSRDTRATEQGGIKHTERPDETPWGKLGKSGRGEWKMSTLWPEKDRKT